MSHAGERARIDAHFAGRGVDERAMRAHLTDCAACRAYYDRHLLLASLDPAAPSPELRLGRALGLNPRRRSRAPLLLLLAPAAAALTLFMVGRRDGFTPRGGTIADAPALVVYRAAGRTRDLAGLRRGDELAFAYRNPGGSGRLMVFSVDEHRHVYWYFPAWTDPASDPEAIPIERTPVERELPEAISQPLDGDRVTLFALFTDDRRRVRDVEAELSRRGSVDPRGGRLWQRVIELRP